MNSDSLNRRPTTKPARRGRPRVGKQPNRGGAIAALLDAAEDVLATRGLEATTIAAIAGRAGVAVGTLYNYFPDRDQLLASLFRTRREQLLPQIQTAARIAQRFPFERRLRAFLGAVLTYFEQHRKFLQVAVAVDQKALKVKDRKPPVITAFTDALVDIMLVVHDTHAPAYAQMIVGATKALVHYRLERGEPLDGDTDLIVDAFLKGIDRA